METKTGIIVTMRREKGYGFIKPDNGEANIFFHAMNVLSPKYEELVIANRVEYLEVDTSKGKRSLDVVAI